MKGVSNLQRTLKHYRDNGYVCAITEHFNIWVKIRQDLFGIFDAVCLKPDVGIVGVQSSGDSEHQQHKTKILANKVYPVWKQSGGKVELISWGKRKEKRGGKQFIWKHRIECL